MPVIELKKKIEENTNEIARLDKLFIYIFYMGGIRWPKNNKCLNLHYNLLTYAQEMFWSI